MPAKHHIDDQAKLIITEWEGKAVDDDLVDAIKHYHEAVQNDPRCASYNEVLNFYNVGSYNFTVKGLAAVGKLAVKTDQKTIKRKLAIIVRTNKDYFLARTYKAYRDLTQNSNKEVQIFTQKDKAYQWVTDIT